MVADSSDIPALLQLTAVQAARGIGINHTKVLQHRPALGDLLVVAGLGWRPGVVGHPLRSELIQAPCQGKRSKPRRASDHLRFRQ